MKTSLEREILDLPLPIYLAGYAGRDLPATEIHDPLYVNCFYLEKNNQRFSLISLDLLGIYGGNYNIIKNRILNGLDFETQLVITSVHTHAAPDVRDDEATSLNKPLLIDRIVETAIRLIKRASANATEKKLSLGSDLITGIGANRRNTTDSVNTILSVLKINGVDTSMLINFNCHPTLLSNENIMISKDYLGPCMDKLLANNIKPMYVQGGCGDISTRFTRTGQTFDEVTRLGELLAAACLKLEYHNLDVTDFKYHEYKFKLTEKTFYDDAYYLNRIKAAKQELEDKKDALSEAELRILITAVQGNIVEYEIFKMQAQMTVRDINLGILSLDNQLAFCFLPFELFSKLQDQIKASSPFEHTLVIGYSFDGLGYLADAASYDAGGYEVLSSGFAKCAGQELVDNTLVFLNQQVKNHG